MLMGLLFISWICLSKCKYQGAYCKKLCTLTVLVLAKLLAVTMFFEVLLQELTVKNIFFPITGGVKYLFSCIL